MRTRSPRSSSRSISTSLERERFARLVCSLLDVVAPRCPVPTSAAESTILARVRRPMRLASCASRARSRLAVGELEAWPGFREAAASALGLPESAAQSRSSSRRPARSARRMPASMKSRMIARSRRAPKSGPLVASMGRCSCWSSMKLSTCSRRSTATDRGIPRSATYVSTADSLDVGLDCHGASLAARRWRAHDSVLAWMSPVAVSSRLSGP
jgi:hypothetical protein